MTTMLAPYTHASRIPLLLVAAALEEEADGHRDDGPHAGRDQRDQSAEQPQQEDFPQRAVDRVRVAALVVGLQLVDDGCPEVGREHVVRHSLQRVGGQRVGQRPVGLGGSGRRFLLRRLLLGLYLIVFARRPWRAFASPAYFTSASVGGVQLWSLQAAYWR